jgi:glycosyltransferase involved in cell wall biosynthesis
MKILLLEPFFTGSHKKWAEEYKKFSRHEVDILSLSGSHWKWRMHGGALSLANLVVPELTTPDLILATDMMDLNLFLSLTRAWSADIPVALYFHENQINYPWSTTDADVRLKRDNHYAFINYASALSADRVFFNSAYHQKAFLQELPKFLSMFPDHQNPVTVRLIAAKSKVLPLGMDLKKLDNYKPITFNNHHNRAVILWNHRWEYDKNAEEFFDALYDIAEKGVDFKLVVLGESYGKRPPIFDQANQRLAEHILHFGYTSSFEEYAKWLWMADLLPVTSKQDFFGGSVIEAMYCNAIPLLPKRLAYPEHIDPQYHSTYFYDDGDFVKKVHHRIMDVNYLRVMNSRQYAEKYDWTNLIETYDQEMEDVVDAKRQSRPLKEAGLII